MYDTDLTKEELKDLLIDEKRNILYYGIKNNGFYEEHNFKINCDHLSDNLTEECDREIAVSYFQMLPLLNNPVAIEEADYIIYGHFYARFHHFRDHVKSQIENIAKIRKPGAKLIVVGKSCNVKPYIDSSIPDIIYFESHYAEKLGKYFNLPIKEHYFVYEETIKQLNIWPVDGCNCKCQFCRHTYMDIPFESLSLDYIKEKLDWYKHNAPEKLQNICLRAENLTEYGIDLYGKQAFPELFNLLESYDEIKTISIGIGLAIGEINEEILNILCNSSKLDEVYLNIETGSNRLLKVIGKKHTIEKAEEVFTRLRESHPNIILNTNIILGLPTEGIEDIISLANHICKISPNGLYILRYENDPDVALAKLPQIPETIYFYHLKLLLSLLKKSNLLNNMLIDCEVLPTKTRKYSRSIEENKRELEKIKKEGFDTAYHLRRTYTIKSKRTL